MLDFTTCASNQKNYTKSYIQTKDLAKYVGKGLLTVEESIGKKQRKLIQPVFTKANLSCWLIPKTILAELKILKLENRWMFFLFLMAFQTVIKSIFNINISGADIDSLQHTTEGSKNVGSRTKTTFFFWWFNLSGKRKKHLDLTQNSRTILKKIMEERKQSNGDHHDLLNMCKI
jgi:cytochrome P450